jgi:hypothetical protein
LLLLYRISKREKYYDQSETFHSTGYGSRNMKIVSTILSDYAHWRYSVSLFLKLTVHSTYTEKLQINEQIKLYTIYTNTVNRQMELAGRK